MAYGNNYSNGNKRYSNNNMSSNYMVNRYPAKPMQSQPSKRSGAKLTIAKPKDGGNYAVIVAWKVNKSNGQIMKMIASKKKEYTLLDGREGLTTYTTSAGGVGEVWTCKLDFGMGEIKFFTGFFNPQTKKLRIPDLNYVASCNAPRGGYFGKSIYKSR